MNKNEDKKVEHGTDVPRQYVGNKLTVEHSVIADSVTDAIDIFTKAVRRLFCVNEWEVITNSLLSNFQLTDAQGRAVFRDAQEDDLFKIDIPGPGSSSGDGFDWVKVEKVNMKTNRVAMRVRPVPSPFKQEGQVAHFFGSSATSTFQVFRRGRIVTAGVYGRNEVPNIESVDIVDKIRNAGVAIGAIAGASRIQWQSLVKGILTNTGSEAK